MRDAAVAALGFVRDRTRSDLDTDTMLTFALVRAIEIIGEAAARISADLRTAHPEIPWSQITGKRNRLVHGDFDVDLDVLWATVTKNLMPLIGSLDAMLDRPAG